MTALEVLCNKKLALSKIEGLTKDDAKFINSITFCLLPHFHCYQLNFFKPFSKINDNDHQKGHSVT